MVSLKSRAGVAHRTKSAVRYNGKFPRISGLLFCVLSIGSILLFGKLKTNDSYIWLIYSLIYIPALFFGLLNISNGNSAISKILSIKPFVWLGNISGYTFLIHQIVIWYIGTILSKIGYNDLYSIIVSFVVTGLLAIVYDYVINSLIRKKD